MAIKIDDTPLTLEQVQAISDALHGKTQIRFDPDATWTVNKKLAFTQIIDTELALLKAEAILPERWPEITDAWVDTYCELTGREPEGGSVTFIGDGPVSTSFRDAARREIDAMLCAAPKSAVRIIGRQGERAVMVCPQCEGEGEYADGVDEAACSTQCTRCLGNGWLVDLAALQPHPGQQAGTEVRGAEPREDVVLTIHGWVRDHTTTALKFAITPVQIDALADAVLALFPVEAGDVGGPLGKPIPDAWIAGFLHGVGREPWEDMHDYAALCALEFAASPPLAEPSAPNPPVNP